MDQKTFPTAAIVLLLCCVLACVLGFMGVWEMNAYALLSISLMSGLFHIPFGIGVSAVTMQMAAIVFGMG